MNELSIEDLNVLIDAVDAWVEKDSSGELIGGLITAMLTDKNPEAQEKMKREREADQAKKKQEKQLAKETAVLLKGKLIQMKYAQQSRARQPA